MSSTSCDARRTDSSRLSSTDVALFVRPEAWSSSLSWHPSSFWAFCEECFGRRPAWILVKKERDVHPSRGRREEWVSSPMTDRRQSPPEMGSPKRIAASSTRSFCVTLKEWTISSVFQSRERKIQQERQVTLTQERSARVQGGHPIALGVLGCHGRPLMWNSSINAVLCVRYRAWENLSNRVAVSNSVIYDRELPWWSSGTQLVWPTPA